MLLLVFVGYRQSGIGTRARNTNLTYGMCFIMGGEAISTHDWLSSAIQTLVVNATWIFRAVGTQYFRYVCHASNFLASCSLPFLMAVFFPLAEVCTLLWLGFTVQLLIRVVTGGKDTSSAKRQFALAWWSYCVPIHLHGREVAFAC